ncbi:WD domain containing protein [Entamoeba marina]
MTHKDEFTLFEDTNNPTETKDAWNDEEEKPSLPKGQDYDDVWKRKELAIEDEETRELLTVSSKKPKKGKKRNEISFRKLPDANLERKSSRFITCCQFHPTDNILISTALDSYLHVFRISGNTSTPILDYKTLRPIQFSRLIGNKVLMTLSTPRLNLYDLESQKNQLLQPFTSYEQIKWQNFSVGKDYVSLYDHEDLASILLDSKTFHVVDKLKGSRQILSSVFHEQDNTYLTCGNHGSINVWDLRTMRCRYLIEDYGASNTISIATNTDGSLIATGSDGGVVNIYNYKDFGTADVKPIHTFKNLVADCNRLQFSGNLLAMSSCRGEQQLRIANMNKMSVFSNFPNFVKIGVVQEIAFSPHSGYFAFGSSSGRVGLFRFNDYPNY